MNAGTSRLVAVLATAGLAGALVAGHNQWPHGLAARSSLSGTAPTVEIRGTAAVPERHDAAGAEEQADAALWQLYGATRQLDLADEQSADVLRQWLADHPEVEPDLRALEQRLAGALGRSSGQGSVDAGTDEAAAVDAIRRAEKTAGDDYRSLMQLADDFLRGHPASSLRGEVQALYDRYADLWDEREFRAAQEFAAQAPESFAAQRARYRRYLDQHGAAGHFVGQASAALERIQAQWDQADYRLLYEFSQQYPHDLSETARRARRYLDEHPEGSRRAAVGEFLAQFERCLVPHDYHVRVRSGHFARSIGQAFTRGPDLAVEVEVAGARIGRTPVVADSFEPVWDYRFPQSIRWQAGDPVRIRVLSFDYRNRTVLVVEPPAEDPLALRFLSGPITADGHQLVFESDFAAPELAVP